MPGHNVCIGIKQFHSRISNSNGPSKMIRNLFIVFFELKVLAQSSAVGLRTSQALDQKILETCFGKFLNLHSV